MTERTRLWLFAVPAPPTKDYQRTLDLVDAYQPTDVRIRHYFDYFVVEQIYLEHPEVVILTNILPDPTNTYLAPSTATVPYTITVMVTNSTSAPTPITAFMAAHQLADVTVVADAGMISEANQHAIEDAGLSFILGTRIPDEPYAVRQWRREHPGQDLPDGQVFIQPWPAAGAQKAAGRRDKTIYYQYKHDRPAAPCGGSMSRWPRPRRRSRDWLRSRRTGSSPWPVARRQ